MTDNRFINIPWSYAFKIERDSIYNTITNYKSHAKGILLDIGCGIKPYRNLFEVNSYIGLEKYPPLCNDSIHPEIYADMHRLPLKNSSIDTILSTQTLEYSILPDLLFKEIARIIRKGGKAIISCPFTMYLHNEPFDMLRYTSHGLKSLCDRNGLIVIGIESRGNFISTIAQMLIAWISMQPIPCKGMIFFLINMLVSMFEPCLKKNNNLCLGYTMLIKRV